MFLNVVNQAVSQKYQDRTGASSSVLASLSSPRGPSKSIPPVQQLSLPLISTPRNMAGVYGTPRKRSPTKKSSRPLREVVVVVVDKLMNLVQSRVAFGSEVIMTVSNGSTSGVTYGRKANAAIEWNESFVYPLDVYRDANQKVQLELKKFEERSFETVASHTLELIPSRLDASHPQTMTVDLTTGRDAVVASLNISVVKCFETPGVRLRFLDVAPVYHCDGFRITPDGLKGSSADFDQFRPVLDFKSVKVMGGEGRLTFQLKKLVREQEGIELWSAVNVATNKRIAAKVFDATNATHQRVLANELNFAFKLRAFNVVPVIDAFLNNLIVVVLFDCDPDLSLRKVLSMSGALDEFHHSALSFQIANILSMLHTRARVVHNDVCLENLFVALDGRVRISGFGFAFPQSKLSKPRFGGTARVMAPEKLLRLECNFASDVWSFGLIAFELATNRFPYDVTDCKTELEIKTMIVSSPAPLIFQKKTVAASSERCHPELWHHFADFLARSLFKSPLLRLSADELCNHAYVATRKANLLPDVNTLKLWTHDFAAAISAQEAAEVDPTPKPRYMMCN